MKNSLALPMSIKAQFFNIIKQLSDVYVTRLASYLAIVAAFAIPLSISLTYISILPAILLIFLVDRNTITSTLNSALVRPLLALIIIGSFTAIFGIHPANSLVDLLRLAILLIVVVFFAKQFRNLSIERLLPFLFVASSIASFHSLLESAFPHSVKKLFVGTVTESGQLALLIPCLAGFIFALNLRLQNSTHDKKIRLKTSDLIWAGAAFILFCTFGFSHLLQFSKELKIALFSIAAISCLPFIALVLFKLMTNRLSQSACYSFCLRLAGPLLIAALLVNLKRGPWVGVTLALMIFFLFYHRRLIIPTIIALFVVVFSITPITERLQQSSRDFFIAGGRSTIWQVGGELAIQYPLGIGFSNSSFLRKFAPEVPPELVHFHSNFLNISVEFGWLGFFIFLWWIAELIRYCFAERSLSYKSLMARGIGCSFIAWQVAGVVEYNFGDSEILILVFLLIGLVIANNGRVENTAALAQK